MPVEPARGMTDGVRTGPQGVARRSWRAGLSLFGRAVCERRATCAFCPRSRSPRLRIAGRALPRPLLDGRRATDRAGEGGAMRLGDGGVRHNNHRYPRRFRLKKGHAVLRGPPCRLFSQIALFEKGLLGSGARARMGESVIFVPNGVVSKVAATRRKSRELCPCSGARGRLRVKYAFDVISSPGGCPAWLIAQQKKRRSPPRKGPSPTARSGGSRPRGGSPRRASPSRSRG